ncbi:MAG: hypothetical protein F2817_03555, partial [Actinobacteria bacterium]|nr:hypothetical protein [Actinomycetota bacterium]
MSDGRAGTGGRGPGLPDLGAAGLSRGEVDVALHPVRTAEHAAGLVATLGRIRGVAGVATTAHDGARLRLVVDLARPVPLGSELRRALHRHLVSCTYDAGGFVVALTPTAGRAPAGAPAAPRSPALVTPDALAAATRVPRPRS